MKRKKLFIVLSLVAVLLVSFTVYAAAADTDSAKNIRYFFGIDTSKLTDKQKSDLDDSLDKMTELQKDTAQKMADLKKEAINKMVENGSMTKEQGDAAIKKIDEQLKLSQEKVFGKGFGMDFGMGKKGPGLSSKDEIDLSKLTDSQKTDLKASLDKLTSAMKDAVNKMVENNSITRELGDKAINLIDKVIENYESGDFSKCLGLGYGRHGLIPGKLDYAKLTDTQKNEIKEAIKNISAIRKEIVNKLVSYGAITKEKGDAALNRIDSRINNIDTLWHNGSQKMRKARPQGRRNMNDSSSGTNTQNTL